MTLSNYPPNVTGREDYFGPRWEGPKEVECGQPANLPVFTNELRDEVLLALGGSATAKMRVRSMLDDLPVVEAVCPFAGEVDVSVFTFTWEWTCPCCGYEHSNPLPDLDE